MIDRQQGRVLIAAIAVIVSGGSLADRSLAAEDTTVAALAERTHFHGIAVDARDPSRIYLATHHGLYAIAPDGKASRISTRDDFMGFTAHPKDPLVLYASGHPEGGGNLGFIVSNDRGRSWKKLSDGVRGPVDFHQMDVSKADPNVIYGVYGDLQRSADGGRTWTRVAPAPEGILGIATSSRDANTLYAATQKGLLQSLDAGRSWRNAHLVRRPATTVHVTHSGDIVAFIVGTGLVRSRGEDLQWQVVSMEFRADYVLHLATDPSDAARVYAVTINPQTHKQAVVASRDGGANWTPLGSQ